MSNGLFWSSDLTRITDQRELFNSKALITSNAANSAEDREARSIWSHNPEVLDQRRRPVSAACFHELRMTLEQTFLYVLSDCRFRLEETRSKIVERAGLLAGGALQALEPG